MKTWIASIATVAAAIGILPGQARADRLSDIDELACLLQDQAAEACYEIRYHFSGAPNYRHLYADTYELYRQAERIHDLVHRGAPLPQVLASVDELDELYHHTEEVVAESASGPRDSGVHGGGYHHVGYGHSRFSSYHLRRLNAKISDMGETIHALGEIMQAAGGTGRGRIVQPPLPPESLPGVLPGAAPGAAPSHGPAAPVSPHGSQFPSANRRSIQFGNSGLRFTVNLGR